jgi:hypothetical protein
VVDLVRLVEISCTFAVQSSRATPIVTQGNHKGLPLQWPEATWEADPSIVGAIPCGRPTQLNLITLLHLSLYSSMEAPNHPHGAIDKCWAVWENIGVAPIAQRIRASVFGTEMYLN